MNEKGELRREMNARKEKAERMVEGRWKKQRRENIKERVVCDESQENPEQTTGQVSEFSFILFVCLLVLFSVRLISSRSLHVCVLCRDSWKNMLPLHSELPQGTV